MIQKFYDREEHGYRIGRRNRDDGICITIEHNNEEWHINSEIIKEYRLFIDYNSEENLPKRLYFKDGRLIKGNMNYPIFQVIQRNLIYIPKKDRLYLEDCLKDIDFKVEKDGK